MTKSERCNKNECFILSLFVFSAFMQEYLYVKSDSDGSHSKMLLSSENTGDGKDVELFYLTRVVASFI